MLCRQASLQPLDAHCTTSADEVPSNYKESAQGLEELCSSPPMIWEFCLFELPLSVLVWPWLSTAENTICWLGVTAWRSFVTTMEINDSRVLTARNSLFPSGEESLEEPGRW